MRPIRSRQNVSLTVPRKLWTDTADLRPRLGGGAGASNLTLSGDLPAGGGAGVPDESAIHVILAKLPLRQVWWAVLSAIRDRSSDQCRGAA